MRNPLLLAPLFLAVLPMISGIGVCQDADDPPEVRMPGKDNTPEVSDEEWKEFASAVRQGEDYALYAALRRDALEPEIQKWESELNAVFDVKWMSYLGGLKGFTRKGVSEGFWTVSRQQRTRYGVDKPRWVLEYSNFETKESSKAYVPDDKIAEVEFEYAHTVSQGSPLDRTVGEISAHGQSADALIRDLCEAVDADYVLPASNSNVTLKLRGKTARMAIYEIGDAAGWVTNIDDPLGGNNESFLAWEVFMYSDSRLFKGGDLKGEGRIRAALRDLLNGNLVTLEPGDICVTAYPK